MFTVECQMLIRQPQKKVFQAFIDPELTSHFWFTKSSGLLEAGKEIRWEWEMYHHQTTVKVIEIIENEKIKIIWGDAAATTVEFLFTPITEQTTYVVIKNYGFTQTGEELLQVVMDVTGGFTTVLDGLKAYMEHDTDLHLIADKFAATPTVTKHVLQTLAFSVRVNAPAEKVWDILWSKEGYRQWTAPFCEGSYYETSAFEEGNTIRLLSPDGKGLNSILHTVEYPKYLAFQHIGEIDNFKEVTPDGWEKAMETYEIIPLNTGVEVITRVETAPEYVDHMNRLFPLALNELKRLAEK